MVPVSLVEKTFGGGRGQAWGQDLVDLGVEDLHGGGGGRTLLPAFVTVAFAPEER